MKGKGRGWRGESVRHGLASRGIKTGRKSTRKDTPHPGKGKDFWYNPKTGQLLFHEDFYKKSTKADRQPTTQEHDKFVREQLEKLESSKASRDSKLDVYAERVYGKPFHDLTGAQKGVIVRGYGGLGRDARELIPYKERGAKTPYKREFEEKRLGKEEMAEMAEKTKFQKNILKK